MRLIDADALIQSVGDKWTDYDIELVESFPTIDAVPVVRCPSCQYHEDIDGYHACRKLRMRCPNDAEFFCKYGLRREDGDGDG